MTRRRRNTTSRSKAKATTMTEHKAIGHISGPPAMNISESFLGIWCPSVTLPPRRQRGEREVFIFARKGGNETAFAFEIARPAASARCQPFADGDDLFAGRVGVLVVRKAAEDLVVGSGRLFPVIEFFVADPRL